MYIDVNINSYVLVKLTGVGIEELKKQHDKFCMDYPIWAKPFKAPETDENGYVKFQMYELFGKFGHLLYNGNMRLPFETTIRVEGN